MTIDYLLGFPVENIFLLDVGLLQLFDNICLSIGQPFPLLQERLEILLLLFLDPSSKVEQMRS